MEVLHPRISLGSRNAGYDGGTASPHFVGVPKCGDMDSMPFDRVEDRLLTSLRCVAFTVQPLVGAHDRHGARDREVLDPGVSERGDDTRDPVPSRYPRFGASDGSTKRECYVVYRRSLFGTTDPDHINVPFIMSNPLNHINYHTRSSTSCGTTTHPCSTCSCNCKKCPSRMR